MPESFGLVLGPFSPIVHYVVKLLVGEVSENGEGIVCVCVCVCVCVVWCLCMSQREREREPIKVVKECLANTLSSC